MKTVALLIGLLVGFSPEAQAAPLLEITTLVTGEVATALVTDAPPNSEVDLAVIPRRTLRACTGSPQSCFRASPLTNYRRTKSNSSGTATISFITPEKAESLCFAVRYGQGALGSVQCAPVFDSPCIDDAQEPNDTPKNATIHQPNDKLRLAVCPENRDYHLYNLTPNQTIEFKASFRPSEGDLDLSLFNSTGGLIDRRATPKSPETLRYTAIGHEQVVLVVNLSRDNGQLAGLPYLLESTEVSSSQTLYANASIDNDGDGYLDTDDCNDNDPLVWQTLGCFPDGDGDGYGDPAGTLTPVCSGAKCANGWASAASDCDDTNASIWRNLSLYPDLDGDSFGDATSAATIACSGTIAPVGTSFNNTDCNDADAALFQTEGLFLDFDEDGYGDENAVLTDVCTAGSGKTGWSEVASDCDDLDPTIWLLEDLYIDGDLDGFGDVNATLEPSCSDGLSRTGYSTTASDCDDSDPAIWTTESLYTDADQDGFGDQNEFGFPSTICTGGNGSLGFAVTADDCDDTEPTVYPTAIEIPRDGTDQDCDGQDKLFFFDTFENGLDSTVWSSVTGDTAIQTVYAHSGISSRRLGGGVGIAETQTLDTSACSEISFAFMVKRGPDQPETGDSLSLSYFDGTSWILADQLFGGATDATFLYRAGQITDPAAFSANFRLKFESKGTGLSFDDFFVDNFTVACGVLDADANGVLDDTDGDGVADPIDCAPADPASWTAIATWPDSDNDGYGDGASVSSTLCHDGSALLPGTSSNADDCDDNDPALAYEVSGWDDVDSDGFGDELASEKQFCALMPPAGYASGNEDCNDGDPLINPGSIEVIGDGVDQNCDGKDELGDDFELGDYDWKFWSVNAGDMAITSAYAHGGTYSMNMGGGVGTILSVAFNTSACNLVRWEYAVKRGPEAPDANEFLTLSAMDINGAVKLDEVEGDSTVTTDFEIRTGSFPATLATDSVQILFDSSGTATGNDDFFVDDFKLTCSADDDQDGFLTADDCDDTDPLVWNEMILYPDVDNDGFGDRNSQASVTCVGSQVPIGWSENNTDCDDQNSAIFIEMDLYTDADNDGFGDSSLGFQAQCVSNTPPFGSAVAGGDCDDTDSAVWFADAAYIDADDDGFGDLNSGIQALCTSGVLPANYSYDSTDCDDNDALNWLGVLGFIDSDGDGYGAEQSTAEYACSTTTTLPAGFADNNRDCDDTKSNIRPGLAEIDGDNVDQNCDGFLDTSVLDDFETGGPDSTVWEIISGDGSTETTFRHSGSFAYALGGGGGQLQSKVFDTTKCSDVGWAYYGRRGTSAPTSSDSLDVRFFDGTAWKTTNSWLGDGSSDTGYVLRWGIIPDILAFHQHFRIEFTTGSTGAFGQNQFVLDDVRFGCEDGQDEGDGVPNFADCAPNDPNHWSDCFTCIDLDGDHYGLGCDLGPDCDDNDPDINPGETEIPLDGFDQNCDGRDQLPFFDGFETGGFDLMIWESVTGDAEATNAFSRTGGNSIRLGGGGSTVITHPFDSYECTRFEIEFWVKRGPEVPDVTDNLVMEYRIGSAAWTAGVTVYGDGVTDTEFVRKSVFVSKMPSDPNDVTVRFTSNGTDFTFDHFFVDDFEISCGL